MDNTVGDSVYAGERDVAVPPRRHLEVWLPMVIVAVDQATKAMIRASLAEHESRTVIPGLMDFTHVLNSGAAFGFLNGVDFPFKTVVIAVIATAALIGVGVYAANLAHHQIVRLVSGSVVDFVDVYWGTHHFWAFNVADSAISVGVAIMILDMLGVDRRSR